LRAVELIEYDRLTPEKLHQRKVDAQLKVVRKLEEEKARKEERIKMAKKSLEKGLSIDLEN
jgi:hypothetical protein